MKPNIRLSCKIQSNEYNTIDVGNLRESQLMTQENCIGVTTKDNQSNKNEIKIVNKRPLCLIGSY